MDSSDYSSDDCEDCSEADYEFCCARGGACPLKRSNASGNKDVGLPFDAKSIQDVILSLSDKFSMHVDMNARTRSAIMMTTGLALAGSMLGKRLGGGALGGGVLGGVVGGACGVAITYVSMRDVWDELKSSLCELYEITYDFLAAQGVKDYRKAASMLLSNQDTSGQLAQILAKTASTVLGKNVITNVPK